MNTIYNVVWNSTTNTWVVASEMAKGRKKKSARTKVIAAATVFGAGSVLVAGGAAAQVSTRAGGLELCPANPSAFNRGTSYGSGGSSRLLPCTEPDARALSFSLNNFADSVGGTGFFTSTARVTGLKNGTLEFLGNNGISVLSQMRLNNNKITGLAPGTLSDASADAVNGSQLFATNKNLTDVTNKVNNLAVSGTGNKYFHTNSALADSQATAEESIAVGPEAKATDGRAIAIGWRTTATAVDGTAVGAGATATQWDTTAIGDTAKATGLYSQAFGSWSHASGELATTVGYNAWADGKNAVAVGHKSRALAEDSIAIGNVAAANGVSSVAVGASAKATGVRASAFGLQATASGADATAIGINAAATQDDTTAIGDAAMATGVSSQALGAGSQASGEAATTVGFHAKAAGKNALAAGVRAQALEEDSIAVGNNSEAKAVGSVALGAGSVADRANTVAVGSATAQRQITNLARGTADTDGVNVSQLKGVTDVIGGGAGVNPDGTVNKPTITVGGNPFDNVTGAIESLDDIAGKNTTNITNVMNGKAGLVQQAAPGQKLTVGKDTDGTEVNFTGTAGDRKLSGVSKGTADTDAVNVSQLKDSGLIDPTTGEAQKAVLFNGPNGEANVAGKKIVNVGAGTDDTDAVNVSQLKDSGLIDPTTGKAQKAVLFNGPNGEANVAGTKIVNVGAGTAKTDAVNVSQLETVVDSLGGGAKIDPNDGTVTGPTYKVTNIDNSIGEYNNVGDAITNLDQRATHNTTSITNLTTGKAGLVQQAAPGQKLTVGKDTDGTEVNFTGTAGDRKLTGVSKGTADNDAVNVSQLKDVGIIDPTTGKAQKAVLFNGPNGEANVAGQKIVNVGAGTADTDAVNVSQLKGSGIIGPGGEVQKAVLFNGPNGEANVAGKKIVNVADGTVSATSKDAVNGSQLFATNQTVNNITNGGGIKYFHTNSTLADSQAGGSESVAVGGGASSGGNRAIAIGVNANASATDSVALGGNSIADRVNSVSVGSNTNQRQIINLARGTADTDGVNVSQLKGVTEVIGGGAGLNPDGTVKAPTIPIGGDTYNNITEALTAIDTKAGTGNPLSVVYDDAKKETVTLNKGGAPVTVSNVKDGIADSDAVNVSQLKDSGLIDPTTGKAQKAVLFNGPNGEANVAGTKIVNVGAGTADTDAVNVSQLKDSGLIDPTTGKAQKAVLFNGPNGEANVAGQKIVNVGAGTADTDAVNVSQLKDSGLIDPTTGKAQKAVLFNGPNGEANVAGQKIVNVGAGTADTDAVNVSQLKDSGIIDPTTGKAQKAVLFNGPNGEANVAGKKIVNVADGTVSATSKDAVNGSQLFATNQTVNNITNGGGIKYFHANSTLADSLVGGSESIAVGGGASAGGTRAIAIGANTTASAIDSVALGGNSIADRVNSVSVGSDTNQRQITNLARGTADTDGVNVSQLKGVTEVIGGGAGINPDGTVNKPTITIDGDDYDNVTEAITAINTKAGTGNPLSVVYDDAKKETVTLNKGGAPVTVSNVKDGIADSDAVNVSQLKDSGLIDPTTGKAQKAVLFNGPNGEANVAGTKIVNVGAGTAKTDAVNVSQLETVVGGLGGGAKIDPNDGTVTGPTYKVTNIDNSIGEYNNVGDAITNLDQRATHNTTNITNLTTGKAGLVQQAAPGQKLTVGKDTDGTEVNFTGTAGDRKLTGVSKGTADNDAVNVSQLKDVGIIDPTTGKAQKAVLFNGPNGEANVAGQKIVNVGAGTADTDAVNVSQLKDSGLIDPTTGKAQKAVLFNGPNGEANVAGKKIVNVGAGTADTDAVNVSQLKDSGIIDPTTGKAQKAVLFNGPNGEANVAGKKIVNVGAGTADTDAVNVSQLKDSGIIDPTTGKAQKAVLFNGPNGEANVDGQKIVNVADGGVSAASKDAINGSQLFATSQSVANALGGGAKVNPNGTVANPTYTVHKVDGTTTTVNNVGDALDNVDGRITNIATSINNGGVGLVQQAAKGQELTVGKNTDGAKVNFTGTAGNLELTGVAKGTADTSAVNVSQLKTVVDSLGGGSKIGPDGTVTGPTYKVTNIDNSIGEYNNVGDAITHLDGRTTHNTTNITNLMSGKAGLVQQAAAGQKLTVGKDTDGTEVNFTGTAGDRKLTGVAKGTADNDAVNVSQLKDAGLVNPDGKVANVVTYDGPDKASVTLGGAGATQPVKVKNVADATADDEAVNLGQLKGTGLVSPEGKTLEAVVYDAGSNKASVTFGGANGTVLNNVADGRIEAGSRQGVNGGQIASLRDQLQGQITNIDGRVTKIEQNGTSGGKPDFVTAKGPGSSLVAPKPANASDSGVALGYDSVAAGNGASAVGDHASANATNGTAVGSNARVEEAASNAVALGSGSVADRANTVSVGSAGQTRAITNVEAGTADHDAVNVKQLNQRLADANQYTDQRVNDVWNDLTNEIDEANTQANRGIAAASALINVTPYLPGRTAVNAGVASYRGETALGVGVSRWSDNGRVNFNAGVSAAQGDEPVFRVGVGYVF